MSAGQSRFAKDLAIAVAALAVVAGVVRVLWPNREVNLYVECHHNLRDIATSLEMYSTDNQGHYPPRLSSLTPEYLKEIPRCPAAGSDTYSAGYQNGQIRDAYTVWCSGRNHALVSEARDIQHYDIEAPWERPTSQRRWPASTRKSYDRANPARLTPSFLKSW